MKISDSRLRDTIAVLEYDLAAKEKQGDLNFGDTACSYYHLQGRIEGLKEVLTGKYKVGKQSK